MRRRWYYWRRMLYRSRLFRSVVRCGTLAVFIMAICAIREPAAKVMFYLFQEYGVLVAGKMMENQIPVRKTPNTEEQRWSKMKAFSYMEDGTDQIGFARDPVYERFLAAEPEKQTEVEENNGERDKSEQEVIALKPQGSVIIREKLADYDYTIQNFYSIHPTTSAGRDLVDVETFLSMDLSIEKNTKDPQILIYHTHSQEEFADYPENAEATIVGVGACLADLLRARGYQVIHDTSVYDVRDGKLDRNQAYTYALDGITGILQKHPTIQVVLDLHRDGVDENTRLVTEINGKPTAKFMFFNGTSQTPDGLIEYLPNPNRAANLAFSFQMQLKAAEQYPGLTRKIYLKGLRYNQHVRARTALVEVGAQTNTYAEALNAMEPLAELISQVLEGR